MEQQPPRSNSTAAHIGTEEATPPKIALDRPDGARIPPITDEPAEHPKTDEPPAEPIRSVQPDTEPAHGGQPDRHGAPIPRSDDTDHTRAPEDEPSAQPREISDRQRHAVYRYTDPDEHVYAELNNRLRHGTELDPGMHELARDISAGLRNLPPYEGTVWRGCTMNAEEIARYTPGTTITEHALTSTSTDRRRIITGNVEFVIHSSSGRDISALSARRNEREVLFDRETSFEVRGVVHDRNANLFGVTRIYLYETPAHLNGEPGSYGSDHAHGGGFTHPESGVPYDGMPAGAPSVGHGADRTAIGDDPQARRVFHNLRNEGEHDVIVHGNRFGRPIPGKEHEADPQRIVEAIRGNPNYAEGTPVRLIASHAGNDIGWAQHVADELGVPVRAPSGAVGVRQRPDSPAVLHDGGHWVTFYPADGRGIAPQALHDPAHPEPDGAKPHHTVDSHEDRWDIMDNENGRAQVGTDSTGRHRKAGEYP
jgi:hypothetical protein